MSKCQDVIRNIFSFIDYFILLPFLSLFPVPAAYQLARWRGRLRAWWDPVLETRASSAAKRLLGVDEPLLASRYVEIVACDELDAYLFLCKPFHRVAQFINIEGEEFLHEVKRQGKGAILLSAHYGGGFFIFPLLRTLQVVPQIMMRQARKEDYPGFLFLYLYSRFRGWCVQRALGAQPLLSGEDVRQVSKIVRQGAFLYITLDVPPHSASRTWKTEFFGQSAHFPYGAFLIAARAKVPIVPFFSSLDKNNHRTFRFFKPIWLTTDRQDMESAFHHCVQLLETEIRARPEQWFFWQDADSFFDSSWREGRQE